jgi:hypothetical protein
MVAAVGGRAVSDLLDLDSSISTSNMTKHPCRIMMPLYELCRITAS